MGVLSAIGPPLSRPGSLHACTSCAWLDNGHGQRTAPRVHGWAMDMGGGLNMSAYPGGAMQRFIIDSVFLIYARGNYGRGAGDD